VRQRAVPACRLPVRNENQRAGSADVAPGPGRVRRRGEVCAARDSEWDRCGAFSHTRHGLLSIYRSASAYSTTRIARRAMLVPHVTAGHVGALKASLIVAARDVAALGALVGPTSGLAVRSLHSFARIWGFARRRGQAPRDNSQVRTSAFVARHGGCDASALRAQGSGPELASG
jgi:hypothetical protein